MQVGDVLGRVTLVTGKEEYLSARTVEAVRDLVRTHDPEAEFSDTTASDLTLATLGELSAPSLFSSVRCVVVRGFEDLPAESVDGILEYAAAPAEDVAVVLVHGGGQKGSGVLAKLRKLSSVTEHKSGEVKPWEMPKFAIGEARRLGARMDQPAAEVLVAAVGSDLRALAAAVDQLVHDLPRQPLDEERVKRYFGGRAEVKNYEIAEAMLAGRRERALHELRWALESGASEVYILSTVAGQLRSLANHVGGNRDGGMPGWKLKKMNTQARGWGERELGLAIRAVAQADADLKGAASDPSYTLERLVLTIAGLRER
ncbi:DNA polymerase III subunit delta [Nocardioides panacisoli]|uniref:DNA polymerase III subunit delta n=1 Tax=Nocardioides panacisoli TaxID=627624 RepID=UPI001C62B5AD|nr:DNA polymerase III subunit delta [Nocardioides panacisoli]QYJ04640.1 DNA polymerase III subunit delta [Nocardioides panacisoli]